MAEIVINDVEPRDAYTAAGGETGYSYTFPIFDSADLVVLEIDTSGNLSILSEGTHYTVAGVGGVSGGTITFDVSAYPSGLTAGYRYVLYRDLSISRSTDFLTGGDFKAATVNRELDKIIMMLQQLERDVARALTLKQEDAETSVEFKNESSSTRLGKLLSFDSASGNIIEAVSAASISASAIDTLLGGLSSNDFLIYNGTSWANKSLADTLTLLGFPFSNLSATAAPTVNDDSGDGYSIGSQWYDSTNDNMYHCLDATLGAAVWVQGDIVAADLGAAALKGVDTDIDGSSTDDDLATAEAVWELVTNNVKGTKATQSTGTSLASGAWTALTFDAEEYDDGGWHNTSVNNSRITVDADGRYLVDAACEANTTANGDVGLRFKVNGTVVKSMFIDSGALSENLKVSLTTVLALSSGDYVEVEFYNDSGSLTSQTANTFLIVQRLKLT